jgi:shikimate dehydrogenase
VIINQNTNLYGVVGFPLDHSLSPTMHNSAFAASGLNAIYLAFETNDLSGCISGMRAFGIRGISVTLPHKSAVIPHLDEVDDLAKKIGAVNTIVNVNGHLVGYNTDALGALKALEEKIQLSGKTCILVGAGGAARAIGFILKQKGVKLKVVNRTPERGRELAQFLACPYIALDDATAADADILIQATSVGMTPGDNACPVPEHVLREGMLVMDIIYNPIQTTLLKKAKSRGCLTINGLGMFIHQGAEQFRLWTGMDPPFSVMLGAVEQSLMKGPQTHSR